MAVAELLLRLALGLVNLLANILAVLAVVGAALVIVAFKRWFGRK